MELDTTTWIDPVKKDDDIHKFTRVKVLSILSALGNGDSFEIFVLAYNGLDATTEILKRGHFTRKRYYVRLRELVELGLLHKLSGKYVHTLLGKKVYEDSIKRLEQAVIDYTPTLDRSNTVTTHKETGNVNQS